MKTAKMLTRLLGEVIEQRDRAISERDEALHGESAMALLKHEADARLSTLERDYPLRLLRDITGLDWAWIYLHEGRAARALIGGDAEWQMELYQRNGAWTATRTYYPPSSADKGKRSPYGKAAGGGEGASAGEALIHTFTLRKSDTP